MSASAEPTPRALCLRCMRPESVCYCRHLPTIETTTRVVLLQHPRERDMAIGTARMAHLCLAGSELHVGVTFSGSPALERALSDPARPAALLYPGPSAIDVAEHPPRGPITLIVVDGTWWQTKKMIRVNPGLARLPRYAFHPPRPSEYRIRREPHDVCVSTIEAICHVLGALEGDPKRFEALLVPFRAMIDTQITCRDRLSGGRQRHTRPLPATRPGLPTVLRQAGANLVCVVGEANAWPYGSAERKTHGDELVHWVGRRLSTGETFDYVVRPARPVAPGTSRYTRLDAETLASGGSADGLCSAWRAFVKESDVLCTWGRYATRLFSELGGELPPVRVDLREVARNVEKRKVGTMEDYGRGIGSIEPPPLATGRAGARLAQLSDIARHFVP
jgi:DTW domain-containing protein